MNDKITKDNNIQHFDKNTLITARGKEGCCNNYVTSWVCHAVFLNAVIFLIATHTNFLNNINISSTLVCGIQCQWVECMLNAMWKGTLRPVVLVGFVVVFIFVFSAKSNCIRLIGFFFDRVKTHLKKHLKVSNKRRHEYDDDNK